MSQAKDIDLRWIRIFDPVHIPKKYIEQIKDRDFDIDKFYRYQKEACHTMSNGKVILNSTNLLYVLADEENIVKGVCWMVVDALSNALVINTFSLDNEYWGSGKCIKMLQKKALEIKEGAELDKIYWVTRCPKHSERHGFKKSRHTLMEYVGNGKDTDGIAGETSGESTTDDSTTGAVSEQLVGVDSGTS